VQYSSIIADKHEDKHASLPNSFEAHSFDNLQSQGGEFFGFFHNQDHGKEKFQLALSPTRILGKYCAVKCHTAKLAESALNSVKT